jgi:conjugal transfer mating pair stabilization protein TraG
VNIHSYGGGNYLFHVFNFVAMLVKADGGISQNIIRTVVVSGWVWVVISMFVKNSFRPGAMYVVWLLLVTSFMVGPKVRIYVNDPISLKTRKSVDNVPFILGAGVSILSEIGHSLTESVEYIFRGLGGIDQPYTQHGLVFGSKLMEQTKKFNISDPVFHGNMERFAQQCVIPQSLIGGTNNYSIYDLKKSTDIWGLVSSKASQALGFFYKDESSGENEIRNGKIFT